MEIDNKQKKIRASAIKLFSKNGYNGTTIREIAKASECSLPMVYYYFTNKEELFGYIVVDEFLKVIRKMSESIPKDLSLEEIYILAIKQRKNLSEEDKSIYKLFMRAYLGVEGELAVRLKLIDWEKKRVSENRKMLRQLCSDDSKLEVFTNIMVAVLENMIERIILLDEDIPDRQIEEQIMFIINSVK